MGETLGTAWDGAKLGYFAWVDGMSPLKDFYADMRYYDPNSADLAASQLLGQLSQSAALTPVGAGLASGILSVSNVSMNTLKVSEQMMLSNNIGAHTMKVTASDVVGAEVASAVGIAFDGPQAGSKTVSVNTMHIAT